MEIIIAEFKDRLYRSLRDECAFHSTEDIRNAIEPIWRYAIEGLCSSQNDDKFKSGIKGLFIAVPSVDSYATVQKLSFWARLQFCFSSHKSCIRIKVNASELIDYLVSYLIELSDLLKNHKVAARPQRTEDGDESLRYLMKELQVVYGMVFYGGTPENIDNAKDYLKNAISDCDFRLIEYNPDEEDDSNKYFVVKTCDISTDIKLLHPALYDMKRDELVSPGLVFKLNK